MTTVASKVEDAKDDAEEAIRKASPVLIALARLGFVAKGVVYTLVGGLALRGSTMDKQDTLRVISDQPFGRTMLGAAGVGLIGYAIWRLIQAIFDPEHVRHDAKAWFRRAGWLASGIVHVGLGLAALRIVFGWGGKQKTMDDWSVTLMAQPLGRWLVGAVGLIVLGVGVWQLYRAWKTKLGDKLAFGSISAGMQTWVIRFGRAGYAARGVVFALIGGFFVIAAYQHRPDEARGFGQALDHLRGISFGAWLMGLVAAGLIAYGLFQFVEARYRRIEVC